MHAYPSDCNHEFFVLIGLQMCLLRAIRVGELYPRHVALVVLINPFTIKMSP